MVLEDLLDDDPNERDDEDTIEVRNDPVLIDPDEAVEEVENGIDNEEGGE